MICLCVLTGVCDHLTYARYLCRFARRARCLKRWEVAPGAISCIPSAWIAFGRRRPLRGAAADMCCLVSAEVESLFCLETFPARRLRELVHAMLVFCRRIVLMRACKYL